ncbi:hypothetical protein [Mariluticola halotolerans]|nr:hypothetical protein [Mariluticola halotolerans]
MAKKKGNQQRLQPKKKKKGSGKTEVTPDSVGGAINAGSSIPKRK